MSLKKSKSTNQDKLDKKQTILKEQVNENIEIDKDKILSELVPTRTKILKLIHCLENHSKIDKK